MEEIKYNKRKAERETLLAKFVDFVESKAIRIDEERRGARRRDGGRKVSCSIFLDQLLDNAERSTRGVYANQILDLAKEIPEEWKNTKGITIPAPLMARIEYNRGVSDAFNKVVPKDYEPEIDNEEYCAHCGFYCTGTSAFCTKRRDQ